MTLSLEKPEKIEWLGEIASTLNTLHNSLESISSDAAPLVKNAAAVIESEIELLSNNRPMTQRTRVMMMTRSQIRALRRHLRNSKKAGRSTYYGRPIEEVFDETTNRLLQLQGGIQHCGRPLLGL